MNDEITGFAPATVANVFVGFDVLGFAIPIMYDKVTVKKIKSGVRIKSIRGLQRNIPYEIEKNTAGYALMQLIDGENLNFGFELDIHKGIPLSSGLGGSAASAVAAVVAVNKLLKKPLPKEKLLLYALKGEEVASGTIHGDNVAASLYGGMTACIRVGDGIEDYQVLSLPIPTTLHCVIIHPDLQIETKKAREIIQPVVSLNSYVDQSMKLTQFLHAIYSDNFELLSTSLEDVIIEPQRSQLIPKFDLLKKEALNSGALGFSISGAGPAMFAWTDTEDKAIHVKSTLKQLQNTLPYFISIWTTTIDPTGAYVK